MSEQNKKIGGEFDIPLDSLFSALRGKSLFASGRHAYRAILRDLKSRDVDTIWLPEYLCESLITATKRESIAIHFYGIRSSYLMDDSFVSRLSRKGTEAFLFIDYFGLVDLTPSISILKSVGALIIVDMFQLFFKKHITLPTIGSIVTGNSSRLQKVVSRIGIPAL